MMQMCVRCGEVSGQRAFLYSGLRLAGSSRLSSLEISRLPFGAAPLQFLKVLLNFLVGLVESPRGEDRSSQTGDLKDRRCAAVQALTIPDSEAYQSNWWLTPRGPIIRLI